jgi:integrase
MMNFCLNLFQGRCMMIIYFFLMENPLENIRTDLKRACRDAWIIYGRSPKGGSVFHNMRNTFNTYIRKAGIPESVIMVINGHSTSEMVDRYDTICQKMLTKLLTKSKY